MAIANLITLTDAAASRVKDLIARSEEPVLGLRVGISTKGCSGMSYVVEYAKEQRKLEDVVEDKGVKIFIEPTAVMFLLGSQRSEEHTSELQSLMRISYAVFCLKKKTK